MIKEIIYNGVKVYSDVCLYDSSDRLVVMSIYGAPQQVKAIASALLMGEYLDLNSEVELVRSYHPYKYKITSLGRGKAHGLIYNEKIGEKYIFWITPEEKTESLRQVIQKKRIPYDPEWLPELEKLLIDRAYLVPLRGWGIQGYEVDIYEDVVCNLIVEEIIKKEECKCKSMQ
jgi:hypothetical protein